MERGVSGCYVERPGRAPTAFDSPITLSLVHPYISCHVILIPWWAVRFGAGSAQSQSHAVPLYRWPIRSYEHHDPASHLFFLIEKIPYQTQSGA